jgi:YVTN family beta-propeller protein
MKRHLLPTLVALLAATGCGGSDDPPIEPTADTGTYVDSTTPDTNIDDTGTIPYAPPTDSATDGDSGPVITSRGMPTNGSAVVITRDDKVAVAVNRAAGTVSVFNLALGMTGASRSANLPVGAEPWAAVIGHDGDTAYVILRKDQKVVRIDKLHTAPAVAATTAKTGSEPTGIAISPSGNSLYVANWAEGTVTVIKTADMSVSSTIDLNAALASSGLLGTVAARPALAHPRAIIVTDSGDANDADETIYVTEFFSQARTTGVPTDDSQFDLNRQGVVYRVNAGTGAVGGIITLAPIEDTGFVDSNAAKTGCFPNQLNALAINNGRLYVSSVCESPRGPTGPVTVGTTTNTANFKTQIHATVFVIDPKTNTELPAHARVLTKDFQALYETGMVADDATRRMPLITNDIAFAGGTNVAYLTAYGSNAVFRVAYKPDGTLDRVGAASANFINLSPGGMIANGELPVGIAVTNAGAATSPFAVVVNESSRNLSVVSLATQAVSSAVESHAAATGTDLEEARGKKFFVTGTGRWSLKGQSWNSCESCHPDGLTDNVTWYFARGPRQTTSLDGSYDKKDSTRRRIFNWTAIFDESHDFELNTRGNSGGLGAVVHQVGTPPSADDRIIFDGAAVTGAQKATATPQAGLSGSVKSLMPGGATTPSSVLKDWDEIDAYIKKIRPPRAPTNLVAADVALGRTLFQVNNCAACHGGTHWTLSRVFYTPNEANNHPSTGGLFLTSYTRPLAATGWPNAINPPTATAATATFRLSPIDGANDQINCILRDVGTFATGAGVAPTGVTVKEVRANMTAGAQGATGFNPPSLVGMVTGAPYFHAGNARTLEEAFSTTFAKHHQAHSALFAPTADQVKQLTAFLLAIDESTAPVTATSITFDPDLCKQYVNRP